MRNNPIVQVGRGPLAARFGASLPLAVIAGPCQMESRAHALETAAALKEIAARRGIGLVYKSSFDKANRTSGACRARARARGGAADLRRNPREAWPAGHHRRARERPVRPGRRGRRRAANPRLPLPPDRSPRRCGAHGPGGQCQEGAVPRALGHEERGRQARRRRGGRHSGDRARGRASATTRSFPTCARCRSWRARPARRSFSTPPIRCSSRAGRGRRRAASGNSSRCWRARRSRSASRACSSRPIPDPDHAPSDGPNMVPLKDFEALVEELQEFDRLAKRAPAAAEQPRCHTDRSRARISRPPSDEPRDGQISLQLRDRERSALKRGLIRLVEKATGQPKLKKMYLHNQRFPRPDESFWQAAVRSLALDVRYDHARSRRSRRPARWWSSPTTLTACSTGS